MNKSISSKSEKTNKKKNKTTSVPQRAYSKTKSTTNLRVTFKNYFSTPKKVDYFIKRQDIRLSRKLKKLKILVSDIVDIDKYYQKKYLDGILKSDFLNYGVHLKNSEVILLKFSRTYKKDSN